MKNRTKWTIEFCLTITLLFINFLSYFLDAYRIFVLILGIIYCLLFGTQLIFSAIKLKKGEFPFGIIATIILIILCQNDSINSNYLIVENPFVAVLIITAIIIMTVILMVVFCVGSKKILKDDFLSFCIISILLSLGSILYGIFPIVNYSFDTTETQIVEVTVYEWVGEDNLKGAFFDTHYLYNVEPPTDTSINQISIDSDYEIELNTLVSIKYRKGIFCEIYKIDYSSLNE